MAAVIVVVHRLMVKGSILIFLFQISIKTFISTVRNHGVLSSFLSEMLCNPCTLLCVCSLRHSSGEQLAYKLGLNVALVLQ